MDMIVQVDLTLALEVLAVRHEQHHASPLIYDTTLGYKAQLLMRDGIAVIGDEL